MLEGALSGVLQRVLGSYLDELDATALSVHLLSGELRLSNVRVKGSALDGLHLPLSIYYGYVGLLHVRWDWARLLSQPIVIDLQDVLILVREKSVSEAQRELDEKNPDHDAPVDAEATHAKQYKQKQQRLAAAEAFRLQPEVQKEGKQGFVQRVINSIIDNIQVHIRNVHIRYEHRQTPASPPSPAPPSLSSSSSSTAASSSTSSSLASPSSCDALSYPCAIGLAVAEVSIDNGERVESETGDEAGESSSTHKVIDINNFFVYCNTRPPPLSAPTTPDSMRSIFMHLTQPATLKHTAQSQKRAEKAEKEQKNIRETDPLCEPMLHPLSGSIRATLNMKEGERRAPDKALAALQVQFPLIDVSLSQAQMHALLHVVSSLSGASKRLSVFSGAYHQRHERSGTAAEKERYIALYKRTMSYSWEPPLSSDEGSEFDPMERRISYECLDDWRVCALAELEAEQPHLVGVRPLTRRQKYVTGLMATVTQTLSAVKAGVVQTSHGVKDTAMTMGRRVGQYFGMGQEAESAQQQGGVEDVAPGEDESESSGQPRVILTSEERESLRAQALSSSSLLFLPSGGHGRDTVQATIDLLIKQIMIRLVGEETDIGAVASSSLSSTPTILPSHRMSIRRPPSTCDIFRFNVDRMHVRLLQRIDSTHITLNIADVHMDDVATRGSKYEHIIAVHRQSVWAAGSHAIKHALTFQPASPADTTVTPSPRPSTSTASSRLTSFLSVSIDVNPLDESADTKVAVHMLPLEIIVHPALLVRLVAFTTIPSDLDLSALSDGGAAAISEMLKVSTHDTRRMLADHKSMSLDVTLDGVNLLIVADPYDRVHTPLLAFHISSIIVTSSSQSKQAMQVLQDLLDQYSMKMESEHIDLEQMIGTQPEDLNHFYDTLNVYVRGVSARAYPSCAAFKPSMDQEPEGVTLIQPFDIDDLSIDQCVTPHLTFLPSSRINGCLPPIQIQLSPSLIRLLTAPAFLRPWLLFGPSMQRAQQMTKKDTEHEQSQQDKAAKSEESDNFDLSSASPPSGPALSMRAAEQAVGFDFGLPTSIQPQGKSRSTSTHSPDTCAITYSRLLIALKSEHVARTILREATNADLTDDDEPEPDERITLKQFREWYSKRKQTLKQNKLMQLNFGMDAITIALTHDDESSDGASDRGQLAAFPSSGASSSPRTGRVAFDVSVRGLHLFVLRRCFDGVVGVEIRSIGMRELLGAGQRVLVQTNTIDAQTGQLQDVQVEDTTAAPCTIIYTQPILTKIANISAGRQSSLLHASERGSSPLPASILPFIFLTLTTQSPDHPDFGMRPTLTDLDVNIGELCLQIDPNAFDRVGLFILQALIPKHVRDTIQTTMQQCKGEDEGDEEQAEEEEEKQEQNKTDEISSATTAQSSRPRRNEEKSSDDATSLQGLASITSMQLRLSFGGVRIDLSMSGETFLRLSVGSIDALLVQRAMGEAMQLSASIAQLRVTDELAEDAERDIIWIAQTHTQKDSGRSDIAAEPMLSTSFKRHDSAERDSLGFVQSVEARFIGLRVRPLLSTVMRLMPLIRTAQDIQTIKVLSEEQKQRESGEAEAAAAKDKADQLSNLVGADKDAPKSGVRMVSQLRHHRPARLQQRQVSPFWSATTPAPIQFDITLNDIELQLVMQPFGPIKAMAEVAAKQETIERGAKGPASPPTNESSPSSSSFIDHDEHVIDDELLVLRVDGLFARNCLCDADKPTLMRRGMSRMNESTVRYEQAQVRLATVQMLSSFMTPAKAEAEKAIGMASKDIDVGAASGAAYNRLLNYHDLDVKFNRFSHGQLVELNADLGMLDVTLAQTQYVFLMRVMDYVTKMSIGMQSVLGYAETGKSGTPSSSPVNNVDASGVTVEMINAPKSPQMLVRTDSGEVEAKKAPEAMKDTTRKQNMLKQPRREDDEKYAEERKYAGSITSVKMERASPDDGTSSVATDESGFELESDEGNDPLRSLPSIHALIRVPRVSIELLRGNGWNHESDGFMSVLLSEFALESSLDQGSGRIAAQMHIKALNVTDRRADASILQPYRQILTLEADEEGAGDEEKEDASEAKEESAIKQSGLSERTSSLLHSSTSSSLAPLLVRAHRLGWGSSHAIEVECEFNGLRIFVSPILPHIASFFALPEAMTRAKADQAKRAAKEKARQEKETAGAVAQKQAQAQQQGEEMLPVGVLASEQEQAGMAPSADPFLIADTVLLGEARLSPDEYRDVQRSSAPAASLPPIYARFRMSEPSIFIVVDSNESQTRGLMFTWEIEAGANYGAEGATNDMAAHIAIENIALMEMDFTVTHDQLSIESHAISGIPPILPPFTIQAHARRTLSPLFGKHDGVSTSLQADVSISRIDLNVGFRLFFLLKRALATIQPQQDEKEKEKEKRHTAQHRLEESVRAEMDEEMELKESAAQDPLAPVVDAQPIPSLSFDEINIHTKLCGVHINSINDAWLTALPFFRIQLDDLSVSAHQFGGSGGVCGEFDLRGEMFNHRMLAWEPLIEPWAARVGLHQCQLTHTPTAPLVMASIEQLRRQAHAQAAEGTSRSPPPTTLLNPLAPITGVSFTSSKPLNFILSAACLEDLTDTVAELKLLMDDEAAGPRAVQHVPRYEIQNHTDLQLEAVQENMSMIEAGIRAQSSPIPTPESMVVQPFSNASFDFPDHVSIVDRAIRVQFRSSHGSLPSLTIPTVRESSSRHMLRPGDGSTPFDVVVDVAWSRGVRVISLHSTFAIINKTNVTMCVSGENRYIEKELAPGERMWLPVIAAPMMHSIRVRPTLPALDSTDAETSTSSGMARAYDWSDEIVLAPPPSHPKKGAVLSSLMQTYACRPELQVPARHLVTGTDVSSSSTSAAAAADTRSRPFHFTLHHSTMQVGYDEARGMTEEHQTPGYGASEGKPSGNGRNSFPSAATSLFHLRTPLTLQNVLATPVSIRLQSSQRRTPEKEEGDPMQAQLVDEVTLQRGAIRPFYHADTSCDTFISLHLDHLAAGWSAPVKLRLCEREPSEEEDTQVHLIRLVGDNGGVLPICMEIQQRGGHARIVLYTQYWIWDLTSLSLQITADKRQYLPARVRDAKSMPKAAIHKDETCHLESISLPDRHHCVMFGYESIDSKKGRLAVRSGRHPRSTGWDLAGPTHNTQDEDIQWSQWSERMSIDAVGNQSAVSIPMGIAKDAGSYEIIADIQAGSGVFRRTKMVKFLPHYVIVNTLPTPICLRSYGASAVNGDDHVLLQTAQQVIWHWPIHVPSDRRWICLKRVLTNPTHQHEAVESRSGSSSSSSSSASTLPAVVDVSDDWMWSGYFDTDGSGDTPIAVRHRLNPDERWFMRVDIRQRDGISFILISEFDDDTATLKQQLPFCISNRSSTETIRVRQYTDARHHGEDSSHIGDQRQRRLPRFDHDDAVTAGFSWIVLPPQTDVPWCWEEPMLDPCAIEVQVAIYDGVDADGRPKIKEWQQKASELQRLVLDEFDRDHATIEYEHVQSVEKKTEKAASERQKGLTATLSSLGGDLLSMGRRGKRQRLHYYSEQEGPTRYVVFSDEPSLAWRKRRMEEHQRRRRLSFASAIERGGRKLLGGSDTAAVSYPADQSLPAGARVGSEEYAAETQVGKEQYRKTMGHDAVPDDPTHMTWAGENQLVDIPPDAGRSKSSLASVSSIEPTAPGRAKRLPGFSSGVDFALNQRNLHDRVRSLRVHVSASRGLRIKNRDVYAKVIVGDDVKQTSMARVSRDQTVQWNEEVVFSGKDIASNLGQEPASPDTCTCFGAESHPDRQRVYVDLYQRNSLLSDRLIGSVSLNLTNISTDNDARWYELRKLKGGRVERRGQMQMAVYFDFNESITTTEQQQAEKQTSATGIGEEKKGVEVEEKEQGKSSALASVSTLSPKEIEPMAGEPRMSSSGIQPPLAAEATSSSTSALAHEKRPAPLLPSSSPVESATSSVSSDSTGSSAEPEMQSHLVQLMADDRVHDSSWSEYRVRLVGSEHVERVASALMLDLALGRIICYVTCPLFRRGYSILVSDRGDMQTLRKWQQQEIIFTLPDDVAANRPRDAMLRLTLYFYPQHHATEKVQTNATLREGRRKRRKSSRSASVSSASSVFLPSSADRPVLLGSTVIPLLSVPTLPLDSQAAQHRLHPEDEEVDEENERVEDTASAINPDELERRRLRRMHAREGEDELSEEERERVAWKRKWLALATPSTTAENAAVCVRVQRNEVKATPRSSLDTREHLAQYTPSRLKLELKLVLFGVSVIDQTPEEVAYFALENLQLSVRDSATTTALQMSLDRMQLDNLTRDAIHPVILAASPVPPQQWLPLIQLAISKQKQQVGRSMHCFDYISFLMQELDVKINELYIYKVLAFVNALQQRITPSVEGLSEAVAGEADEAVVYRKMSNELIVPEAQVASLYFKFLHLQPLAINLTLGLNPGIRNHYVNSFVVNPLTVVLSVLEAGVGSLESAPIRLDGMIIERRVGSPEDFVRLLAVHYIKEGVKQIYRVLGSLEILGNPVGTVGSIGAGVKGFFYEPMKGAMISPEAFGQGLAEGSLNLLRHSVAGVGSAVAGVLGGGSKALAAASLDQDFVSKMSQRSAAQPEHVGEGLRMGARTMAYGFGSGLKGIVMDPVRGAQERGAKGFMRGLGTGLVGLAVKPAAGTLSCLSQTSKGIAHTGEYMQHGPRARTHHFRPKRFIDPHEGRISQYDWKKSEEAESMTTRGKEGKGRGGKDKDKGGHVDDSKHESNARIRDAAESRRYAYTGMNPVDTTKRMEP